MIQRIARRGWRQLSLLVAMLLAFCFLARSLFALQVLQAANTKLQSYYAQDVAAPQVQRLPRGMILDDNGAPLVGTVTVFKLAASPPYVTNKVRAARKLTDILLPLHLPSGAAAHDKKAIARARAAYRTHYQQILSQLKAPLTYVCLAGDDSPTCPAKFDISQATKDKIDALRLPGITLEARSRPSYPNGSLAAQVLGYVTYQYRNSQWVDTGQYGLQEYYDSLLSDVPGHVSVKVDTSGQPIRFGAGADAAPQQGATLTLTIDSYVQYLVEQELVQVVHKSHAVGGTVVVERASDGAILAMASTPSYDPNNWHQIVNKYTKNGVQDKSKFGIFVNPAVSHQYEPGSTFKAFTVAIGFDDGMFNEGTLVNDTGTLDLKKDYGITIRNWCLDSCSFGGLETPGMMLHYSSNIGAAQFGRIIPTTDFYSYLDRFGFGQPTGVDLAGEIPGDIRRPTGDRSGLIWYPSYKFTQAYGQGLTVTPTQLTNAYAALANGGMLPHPHLVQSYTANGKTTVLPWSALRRSISQNTSDRMRNLLVQQAIGGEACLALVPGYDVAAKTGTASIPQFGGYAPNQTIASTAAFAPAFADPSHQFVVLVKVDRPNPQYGSLVAAPAVHDILQHLFEYYKIPPSSDPVQPLKRCHGPDSP